MFAPQAAPVFFHVSKQQKLFWSKKSFECFQCERRITFNFAGRTVIENNFTFKINSVTSIIGSFGKDVVE